MRLWGILFLLCVTTAMLTLLFVRPGAGAQDGFPTQGNADPLVSRANEEGDSGELTYRRYCGGCHGVNGDGNGPAARFLSPRPRDFTRGVYKFASTPAGSPPLDEDLLRTITQGLHGTSMPAWNLLSLGERRSLVRHIKRFYKEWDPSLSEGAIPFHENTVYMSDVEEIEEAIARGNEVYHKTASCWGCHPSYIPKDELEKLTGLPARPNLHEGEGKPDLWGETILPPDFRTHTLKSVSQLKDIYRVITAGVGGTAMPTWKNALSGEQLWALTLYVDSLRPHSIVNQTLENLRETERE